MAPGAANQTRQQLEELDALLEKMLALPNHPGDEANSAPPSRRHSTEPMRSIPALSADDARLHGASFVATSQNLASSQAPTPRDDSAGSSPPKSWSIDLNPRNGSSILGAKSLAAGAVAGDDRAAEQSTPAPESFGLKITVVPTDDPTISRPTMRITEWSTPRVRWPLATGRKLVSFFRNVHFDGKVPWKVPGGLNTLGYSGLAMLVGSIVWGAIELYRWNH